MRRLIERAEAALKAFSAFAVLGIQLSLILAIPAIIASGLWGGSWGPPVVVATLCLAAPCVIAWAIWKRRGGEQSSSARWPKPLPAAGNLMHLAWTAIRIGGWGIARGVELALLIGAGVLIAIGLWQEPWLGVPLGLSMFAAPWIIGRFVKGLAVAVGYIVRYIIYKSKGH
jgi:hypothetical protein